MSRNLITLLEKNLPSLGHKVALYYEGGQDTFRDVNEKARSISANLLHHGLLPGDRVGIHLANIPAFVYAYFGSLMAGAQVVPINVMLKPDELLYMGNDSEIRFVMTQRPFAENLLRAKARISSIEEIFCVGQALEGTRPFEELLDIREFTPILTPSEDSVAVIFYTSGTTGRPKGAMLTHRNLTTNALATAQAYGYGEEDIILFGMPLFHSSGQTNVMNAGFSQGAAMVLMPRFSADEVFQWMERLRVSVFIGVPTMYHQIMNHPLADRFKAKGLRVLIVGAAPMPEALFRMVSERTGLPITEGYGLSEAGPVVCHNPLHGVKKIGSVGLPVEGISVKVVDPSGRTLPVGQTGELLLRGPNVMLGYLNQPEETQAVLKDGWLHTGDLSRIDQDGYIFIVDRKKEMILTGGFNIYPREIEEVLHTHPAVSEAAVIGLPDEEKGELATAFVILKKGIKAQEKEIVEFCRERLAVYKAPRRVRFVEELPRNASGKVLKRLLRERYA